MLPKEFARIQWFLEKQLDRFLDGKNDASDPWKRHADSLLILYILHQTGSRLSEAAYIATHKDDKGIVYKKEPPTKVPHYDH